MEMEQETVYGTHEDSHVVMSEKVQSLAGSVYQEFEKMISKYDDDVVKDLMPLVVNVLECLDISYTQNQEHEVELELLREDNEQLVTQYEREKQLRKSAEQKLIESEDATEDERKELQGKIESLESIVRMLELKGKNASDHVYRLEEKESEMKQEYSKLHERYTDLLKTHMDTMERTKLMMGTTDRLDSTGRARLPPMSALNPMTRSSGPISYGFASLEAGPQSVISPVEYAPAASSPTTSLQNELEETQSPERDSSPDKSFSKLPSPEKGGWSESLSPTSKDSSPETEELPPPGGKSHTKREQRSGNTLYQELSFQDVEALGEMDEGADITDSDSETELRSKIAHAGMGKEVENLIMENNELLATKNALNIVKDDLIIKVDELTSEQEYFREKIKSLVSTKERLNLQIQELQEELKKAKEESEKALKASKSDDEEDVPMAQRKRFTRVEMARVLMERNQYKERFMELQEAVRWTELVRASRNDPNLDRKSKQSIWKFFSNLFTPTDRPVPSRKTQHMGVRFTAPQHVSPAGPLGSMRQRTLSDRKRGVDYLETSDSNNEKVALRRQTERREQYRQVRAHVEKDDGRLRAYGWSLPAKVSGAGSLPNALTSSGAAIARPSSAEPVPVPVYCRPLTESEPGVKPLQIWCAAGVNLSGGKTRDGGSIVGASIFYSNPSEETCANISESDEKASPVRCLEEELEEGERLAKEAEIEEQQLSSLVWICTSTHKMSRVTVVDANNPADVLKAFNVCSSHLLCIASVPGARESDYPATEEVPETPLKVNDDSFTQTSVLQDSKVENDVRRDSMSSVQADSILDENDACIGRITLVSCATGSEAPGPPLGEFVAPKTQIETVDLSGLGEDEAEDINPPRRLAKEVSGLVKDGLLQHSKENDELVNENLEKMSSILPTMWLGAQSGDIYVHSAASQWGRCLHSVHLKDSVLSIVHIHGRVLAALANGTVVVFRRGLDGQWNLNNYHIVDLGPQHHSIRCMVAVHGRVWCGYRNKIHVLDPRSLKVEKTFDAHPRKESQVRQMAWLGDGVWVTIRLDSTLRLYHAHTYQHLQDVDIEPYVSKMLGVFPQGTGKLGFSFARITALLISSSRLWIGTGNGVIISVPLSESAGTTGNIIGAARGPGSIVRVYADTQSNRVTPGSFIPYCSMAQAQLSFHGHREAVKFFVSVPGSGGISAATSDPIDTPAMDGLSDSDKPQSMLVMSGGEGYIDFRVGEEDDDGDAEIVPSTQDTSQSISRGVQSHLIVWQVMLQR
ncbi:C-Jun-amino-terminal kinase-interacting protein 4 isoform X4 [Frankliniella occidentalis]|uniref:JNK-interacting protein 3 n=1 Tax=Frankliniella occidentalis TaxID=133901 RepID=A0A6J1SHX8_FRAOC|nr:C-Jun-amino-terminal kinase-interacting protein 4 isoform X4 [Frankliniella occidentalis]